MSRVALNGYPLGDVEKEYLRETIRPLSSVYFTEVLGFCLVGNPPPGKKAPGERIV
jgi:putative transposase